MSRSRGQDRSQRQHRVGELVRHALADILAHDELRDPALKGVSVTVTQVDTSPDLKNATAWVMPLGGRESAEVEAALNRCARYLRGRLSQSVSLKYAPQIKFAIDYSFDAADRIDELLRDPQVQQDLGPPDTE
ncbi:MAG: 30S ribosome-binding factor RbfA [Alphaproteobacteria bacterium]